MIEPSTAIAAEYRPCSARIALFALTATILGLGIHLRDGLIFPPSLVAVGIAFFTCLLAVVLPIRSLGVIRSGSMVSFVGMLIVLQLIAMFFRRPGASNINFDENDYSLFNLGVGLAAIPVALMAFGRKRRSQWLGFSLVLIIFASLGILKMRTAPIPRIDVYIFHRDAAEALRRGENPYALTFPNIYGSNQRVYAPELLNPDGRLNFGYPYPPLTLGITAGSHLLLGDCRFAMLVALLMSAVMLVMLRPTAMGMLAATGFLFSPRNFFILEQSWIEPICVMFLFATILLARRVPLVSAIAFGLMIASKQYLPVAILLIPLLHGFESRKQMIRFGIIAIAIAAVVSLPALWNIRAFWRSAVTLQIQQPFREDALSFLRFIPNHPTWLAFVALAMAIGIGFIPRRRGAAAFAGAFALAFLAFFALNKQAFANYYFLVISAAWCAVAGSAQENSSLSAEDADKDVIGRCATNSP
jgi:hypothetical protein